MLAFEIEVSDFLERVECAQPGVKLQAVDDLHLVTKPNMFGPQVAVAI